MPSFPITGYSLVYSSNTFSPRIWLYSTNNALIGQVTFLRTSPLPVDMKTASGSYSLFMAIQEYPNIVDLLRNEKPITLTINGDGRINENYFFAGIEPVGENE